MKILFKSAVFQKQFQQDGFVKVQLLTMEEVNELLNEYQKIAALHEQINIPYITTSHSNNPALIKKVDEILQKVMAPAIDKILTNYKLLFGNYLIKMPGEKSETEPHQDITFVDESEFVSLNVWVALQDISIENGCMYFLRGSQNLISVIRPTHHYPWLYENVKPDIKQAAEAFPVKAGEAFIFNHAIIHGSFANHTDQPRIAAVMAAYNADAPLIHYYLPDDRSNILQKFSMTKEAYLHFVKLQPPAKGVFIGEEKYEFKQLKKKEFFLMLRNGKKISVLQKLTAWFTKEESVVNG